MLWLRFNRRLNSMADSLHAKVLADWLSGSITLNEARTQLGRSRFETPDADAIITDLPAWTAFEQGFVGLPERPEDEVVLVDEY